MRYVWHVLVVALCAAVVAVIVSVLWAVVTSWCIIGVLTALAAAGIVPAIALEWTWWIALALWVLMVIIGVVVHVVRGRTQR